MAEFFGMRLKVHIFRTHFWFFLVKIMNRLIYTSIAINQHEIKFHMAHKL